MIKNIGISICECQRRRGIGLDSERLKARFPPLTDIQGVCGDTTKTGLAKFTFHLSCSFIRPILLDGFLMPSKTRQHFAHQCKLLTIGQTR